MDPKANGMFDAIGLMGVVLYVGAYAALQAGFLKGSSYTYTIMNLMAAALILVSLTNEFNLSSAIIQTTWIAISISGLTRHFILHHSTRLSPEEAAFARSKLPMLPRPLLRRFFLAGAWADAEPGTVVATEGEALDALVYILLGEAEVSVRGHPVGTLRSDSFIGELTCFDGGAASATVTVTSPARVFRVSSAVLVKLCARSPDLRIEIVNAIRKDTGIKLLAANVQLSGRTANAGA